MPTNFRSYETQARLLAAVIAAHPGLKLDYKAISRHYGSDMTWSAVEHRFRHIKEQVKVLRLCVQNQHDPKDVDILDKDEICKYFGESTPDGLQFQFRGIKKDADVLRSAVRDGVNPVQALSGKSGSAPVTPRKAARGASVTPSTRGTGRRLASAGKRKAPRPNYEEGTKGESSTEVDYDVLDQTPTKAKKFKATTEMAEAMLRHTPPINPSTVSGAPPAPSPAPAPVSVSVPTPVPAPVYAIAPASVTGPASIPVTSFLNGASASPPSFAPTPTDSDFSTAPTSSQQQQQHATPNAQPTAEPQPTYHPQQPSYVQPSYVSEYDNHDSGMSFVSASGFAVLDPAAGYGPGYGDMGLDQEDDGEI